MVRKGNKKTERQSLHARAGCSVPVTKLRNYFKNNYGIRLTKTGGVCCAANIDYICAELCELSQSVAKDMNSKCIDKRHVMYAVYNDEELRTLLSGVVFNGAGTVPLLPVAQKTVPKTTKAKIADSQ
ncbi:MAG: histone H2A [Marteilia pararefringens]